MLVWTRITAVKVMRNSQSDVGYNLKIMHDFLMNWKWRMREGD